jgi:hypothetical protein
VDVLPGVYDLQAAVDEPPEVYDYWMVDAGYLMGAAEPV